jgi:glutaminyl-tRNA synthetase
VSAKHALAAIRRLFSDPQPDAGGKDFKQALNPNSKEVMTAYLEYGMAKALAGESFQFERHGYFVADRIGSVPGRPVFNRAVTLKDSWGTKL